jgi:hemerythrin-like domain-containing protein
MDAIDTLMNEHRTIERVIDALVAFAGDARRRRVTAREELSLFVGFLQQFADGIHHGKEEHVLFQALLDHGFPREGGPVAMMLLEHARGRALVEVLDRIIPGRDGRIRYHYVLIDYLCRVREGETRAGSDAVEAGFYGLDSLEKMDLTAGTVEVIRRGKFFLDKNGLVK